MPAVTLKKEEEGIYGADMNDKTSITQANALAACNVIKTAMMLLVILYHSMALWLKNGWFNQAPARASTILDFAATWLNSTHIYVFVFISGYIFYYKKYTCKAYQRFFDTILTRAKRLLLPYITVSALWVIPFAIYYSELSKTAIIRDYVLALAPSQLWFLWMIFVLFCIFYCLSNFMKGAPFVIAISVCFAFYTVGIVGNKLIPNYFQIWTACRFFLFYYLGFATNQYGLQEFKRIPWLVLAATNVTVFCFYFFCFRDVQTIIQKVLNIGMGLLCQISCTAMVVSGFFRLNIKRLQNIGLFQFLQNNNYGMFLFHQQLIYMTITALNGRVSNIVLLLCNFLFASSVSALIAWLLNKSKIARIMIGG